MDYITKLHLVGISTVSEIFYSLHKFLYQGVGMVRKIRQGPIFFPPRF